MPHQGRAGSFGSDQLILVQNAHNMKNSVFPSNLRTRRGRRRCGLLAAVMN
jgi:hypothetical protein